MVPRNSTIQFSAWRYGSGYRKVLWYTNASAPPLISPVEAVGKPRPINRLTLTGFFSQYRVSEMGGEFELSLFGETYGTNLTRKRSESPAFVFPSRLPSVTPVTYTFPFVSPATP
jgi:hypothetical protein